MQTGQNYIVSLLVWVDIQTGDLNNQRNQHGKKYFSLLTSFEKIVQNGAKLA